MAEVQQYYNYYGLLAVYLIELTILLVIYVQWIKLMFLTIAYSRWYENDPNFLKGSVLLSNFEPILVLNIVFHSCVFLSE